MIATSWSVLYSIFSLIQAQKHHQILVPSLSTNGQSVSTRAPEFGALFLVMDVSFVCVYSQPNCASPAAVSADIDTLALFFYPGQIWVD